MPQWGLTDQANNQPKNTHIQIQVGSGKTARAANQTALYNNVTPSAFGKNAAIGTFGVSAAEKANTNGESKDVTHSGWQIRTAWEGPITSLAPNAGGTGYANTDTIKVSGGSVNASATLTTNATGGIASITLGTPGLFVNVSSATVSVANSTGGASAGSGATFTIKLGGRAGRVFYETIMAAGSLSNGATDDSVLPQ